MKIKLLFLLFLIFIVNFLECNAQNSKYSRSTKLKKISNSVAESEVRSLSEQRFPDRKTPYGRTFQRMDQRLEIDNKTNQDSSPTHWKTVGIIMIGVCVLGAICYGANCFYVSKMVICEKTDRNYTRMDLTSQV